MIGENEIEAARAQQLQELAEAYPETAPELADDAAALADPYAIPADRIPPYVPPAIPPREPLPPTRVEQLRRSYYESVDLARSIYRLELADRSRILECIAATFPEVVAAAIEDIATRRHGYHYAADLVTP